MKSKAKKSHGPPAAQKPPASASAGGGSPASAPEKGCDLAGASTAADTQQGLLSETTRIEAVTNATKGGKTVVSLLQHERTFLQYQRELREGGTHVLNEAMMVLDIIDVKTQSLLSYIGVSLAALVFLITSIPSSSLRLEAFGKAVLTDSLLVLILALLGASILSLSCLNIVGAHTIRKLGARTNRQSPEEYETLIVSVTLGRRNRYLIAHRISIVTAILTFGVFGFLFASSLQETVEQALSALGAK